ncbi:MAG: hypothetical protein ACR2HN_02070 [Tepidiformaceae bacterium]
MTIDEMVEYLGTEGLRSSGFQDRLDVRGLLGRGAKDCAHFGITEWISQSAGNRARFTLNPNGNWESEWLENVSSNEHGTAMTVKVESQFTVRSHQKLREDLQRHYALRPILMDRRGRDVRLVDTTNRQDDHLVYTPPSGSIVEKVVIDVPGYPGEYIRVILNRSTESLDDGAGREYWRHGLLITSGRAAYDIFGGKFEREPWRQYLGRFFGEADIPGIAEFIRQYDDVLESEAAPPETNPIRLVSRDRRGLVERSEHPFVEAAWSALEAFLQPHIEALKSAEEAGEQGHLSEDTRRRLRELGRLLGQFFEDEEDNSGNGATERALPPLGVSIVPSSLLLKPEASGTVTVRFRANAWSDLPLAPQAHMWAVEGTAKIQSPDFELQDRGGYFSRSVVIGAVPENSVSLIRIEVEGQSIEFLAECRQVDVPEVTTLRFEHSEYKSREGQRKLVRLLAPWSFVADDPDVAVSATGGGAILESAVAHFGWDESRRCGTAPIRVRGRGVGSRSTLRAVLGEQKCEAKFIITADAPASISVELKPEEYPQRAVWDGNTLKVSALDRSVQRCLGPRSQKWPWQHSIHFRTMLAEIVAFHSARRLIENTHAQSRPPASELYRLHMQLEQRCLPRIHAVLVNASEIKDAAKASGA